MILFSWEFVSAEVVVVRSAPAVSGRKLRRSGLALQHVWTQPMQREVIHVSAVDMLMGWRRSLTEQAHVQTCFVLEAQKLFAGCSQRLDLATVCCWDNAVLVLRAAQDRAWRCLGCNLKPIRYIHIC